MAEHHVISRAEEHPEQKQVQQVPAVSQAKAALFNQLRCSQDALVHPRRNYGVPHLRRGSS